MSEQALNRTIDTLMERIEQLRAENLRMRILIARLERNSCQDGPESTGDAGGIVGCQPEDKNSLDGPIRGVATMEGL